MRGQQDYVQLAGHSGETDEVGFAGLLDRAPGPSCPGGVAFGAGKGMFTFLNQCCTVWSRVGPAKK